VVLYSVARLLLDGVLGVASGWEVHGREHVPRSGGLLVASNHISYFDPPIIGTAAVRELHYLAKEELFRQPLFGALIRTFHTLPIRRGMADLSGLTRAIEVLRDGNALVVFPEGSRMRDGELHPARPREISSRPSSIIFPTSRRRRRISGGAPGSTRPRSTPRSRAT